MSFFETPELVAAETLRDQTAGLAWEDSVRDWADEAETGTDEEPDTEGEPA